MPLPPPLLHIYQAQVVGGKPEKLVGLWNVRNSQTTSKTGSRGGVALKQNYLFLQRGLCQENQNETYLTLLQSVPLWTPPSQPRT